MLSTHILSEAQQICDRVLIINQGKILAEDTPNNLQAQLAGAERIFVRTSTDDKTLAKLLGQIPEVEEIVHVAGGVEVSGPPGKDIRPLLARAIVEAELDLLELRASKVSLESVFLQLTQEENDRDASADESE
jgi:ABC-2 type transport system ATP-binding protein